MPDRAMSLVNCSRWSRPFFSQAFFARPEDVLHHRVRHVSGS